MSRYLDSIRGELTAMEQEIPTLPEELDSVVTRLDRSKLRSLFFRLDQDLNKLLARLFDAQRIGALLYPLIVQPSYPYIRETTEEDLAKWRAAWKSDILVVAGKEGIGVIATFELARKYQTTVAQVILAAQQQGNIVLGWDQYRELLDEIGSLIGGDEERGTITSSPGQIVIGVPVTGTESADVKILPKNSLL